MPVLVFLAGFLAFQPASAAPAWYTVTVNNVGVSVPAGETTVSTFMNLSAVGGTFTKKYFTTTADAAKSMLNIGMAANALGRNVLIYVDLAVSGPPTILNMYMIK